jgi:hypothetical protein
MDKNNLNLLLPPEYAQQIQRQLNLQTYSILLEDTERTFNINMHSFQCLAASYEEAYVKMCLQRPEFKYRKVISYQTT